MLISSVAGDLVTQYDTIVDNAVQAFGKFLALNASPLSDDGNFKDRGRKERADLCGAAISAFVAMRRYLGRCRSFEERVLAEDCCVALLRSLSLMDLNRKFVFYAVADEVTRLLRCEFELEHKIAEPETKD